MSAPEDVYEAAARAYNDRFADLGAAIDSAYAAGVAAGRAQAAADIRAADRGLTCSTACLGERCDCAAIEVIEEAAKIAGGDPR